MFNYSLSAQLVPWRLVGGFLLALLLRLRVSTPLLWDFSQVGGVENDPREAFAVKKVGLTNPQLHSSFKF